MMLCPGCRVPHGAPAVSALIVEAEQARARAVNESTNDRRLDALGRGFFILTLKARGYCQTCIVSKGAIIAGEIAQLACFPKSHEQVEHGFIERGSNVLQFPERPRSISNSAMPNKGA